MMWVIAYDIQSHRTRRRVARRLERLGFRRQESVFEGEAEPNEITTLLDELALELDPDADQLTAWPVQAHTTDLLHRGRPRPDVQRHWALV